RPKAKLVSSATLPSTRRATRISLTNSHSHLPDDRIAELLPGGRMPQGLDDVLVAALQQQYERAWATPDPRARVDSIWSLALSRIASDAALLLQAEAAETRRADLSQRVKEVLGDVADAHDNCEKVQERYEFLASELDSALADSARHIRDVARYESQLSGLKARLQEAEARLVAQVEAGQLVRLERLELSTALRKHEKRASEQAERITHLEQQLANAAKALQDQAEELLRIHEQQRADARSKHRTQVEKLEAELSARTERLEKECRSLDDTARGYQARIAELVAQQQQLSASIEQQRTQFDAELEKHGRQSLASSARLEEERLRHAHVEADTRLRLQHLSRLAAAAVASSPEHSGIDLPVIGT
ncbi:hypothetical protein OC834_006544, partial [Tilletia horrida]